MIVNQLSGNVVINAELLLNSLFWFRYQKEMQMLHLFSCTLIVMAMIWLVGRRRWAFEIIIWFDYSNEYPLPGREKEYFNQAESNESWDEGVAMLMMSECRWFDGWIWPFKVFITGKAFFQTPISLFILVILVQHIPRGRCVFIMECVSETFQYKTAALLVLAT